TQPEGPSAMPALSLNVEPEALEPLIRRVVEETLARLEAERGKLDGRLAYSEPEAAALLGLQPHQLRDERRRGRIAASIIVGRRGGYVREDLLRYLMAGRGGPANGGGGGGAPPSTTLVDRRTYLCVGGPLEPRRADRAGPEDTRSRPAREHHVLAAVQPDPQRQGQTAGEGLVG